MQLGLSTPQRPQTASINGVLSAQSLTSILREQAAEATKRAQEAMAQPVVISLVEHIQKHWSLAKKAKEPVEREMLTAVRSRRGEYDPDKLAQIRQQGGSEIYMMIFATKARQLKALLTDILMGTGAEKPWTLSSTPKPDLPPTVANQIMQAVYEETVQAEMSGMPLSVEDIRQKMMDMKAQMHHRIMEHAQAEAEMAEHEIEDVLVEGGFLDALDQFVDDLAVFKTAFIKGPVVRMSNELKWVEGPDGRPTAQVTQVRKRVFERVDPFMVYPSPHARTVHDAPLIERHKLTRGDLSAMIGLEGYSEDAIRAVLDAHGSGGLHEWLSVDASRHEAEGRADTTNVHQGSETIDALQFWGSVSGKMLREWGMSDEEVPDEAKEYEVEAWLVGSWVIRAIINPDPLDRRPYFADGFSRIPGAFWHNSLFDVIRDCQDMCNAAARALSNNLGIASGPQVVVNVDRLPQGENLTELYPWKIHQVTNDPMGSNSTPVTFFQPSSNAHELMGVFERFSSMADEYSGIPKYMAGMAGGEGGAGRTASGMQMMIGNASKQIKNTVSSMDLHIIGPIVERTYQHLMMYEPDLEMAGDLQVRARGATSLLAKEAAQVRLNEFLMGTANPIDMQIVGMDGRAELLRHAVKRLDIPNPDKVVPSASVIKERAAVAQMQQQQLAMQQAAAGGQPNAGSGQELMGGGPTTDLFTPPAKPANSLA